jgi:hypothetical protein
MKKAFLYGRSAGGQRRPPHNKKTFDRGAGLRARHPRIFILVSNPLFGIGTGQSSY